MPIFQVTNRLTHSRAVVIADNERRACELRPDGAIWHESPARAWFEFNQLTNGWRRALPLDGWPDSIDFVHADMIARRAESAFDVEQVVCFESSTDRREAGEGPPEWFEPTGECPECGEPQFKVPSGNVCKNGHGF